jgi:hypothetical protein
MTEEAFPARAANRFDRMEFAGAFGFMIEGAKMMSQSERPTSVVRGLSARIPPLPS